RKMCGGELFVLAEDLRPDQVLTDTDMSRIDRFPPRPTISFVDQLGHGNVGKIRIAHKLGSIKERAPEGFQGQVYGRSSPTSVFRQVVTLENIQDLDQRGPARRRR